MTTPEDIMRIEQDIVLTLKNIYDPEIPVNVYDLGLIYEIDVEPGGEANIRMTLTAPNCPMADQLLEQIHEQVGKVKGVTSVNVTLTFDPPWDRSMMSEETLLDLGLTQPFHPKNRPICPSARTKPFCDLCGHTVLYTRLDIRPQFEAIDPGSAGPASTASTR